MESIAFLMDRKVLAADFGQMMKPEHLVLIADRVLVVILTTVQIVVLIFV